MNYDLENGFTLAQKITDCQNSAIRTHGDIGKNDPKIWNENLHRWRNRDCLDIIAALSALIEELPQIADPKQTKILENTALAIIELGHIHDRVLDTKIDWNGRPVKSLYWQFTMTVREILNRYDHEQSLISA
jgi:hypothetical protein